MASTNRLLSFLFLGAIAAAISACASPQVQECGATGVYCPAGTHCAAAQGICISDTNTCGNAHLDPGEVCDDGNTKDGDGCSANCLSDESCGNNILDTAAGEKCDDGNTVDGDGCSANCKSLEMCGNGIKDIHEACDDGNNNDSDGCSHDCKSTEVCGNGIVDREVGEVCDPPAAGTCGSDCRSLLSCGNKIIDDGEECDDGQADNGDDKDCRSDCVINRCGDGRPNINGAKHHEDCDRGPKTADHIRDAVPTEADNCNIDCTMPKCGDGKVNRSFKPNGVDGEQCDDVMVVNMTTIVSLNANDRDCTADCQRNVCGDGHINTIGPSHKEGCDDHNQIDTDSCTNACVAQSCGDGIVDPDAGEECDLGRNNSDTGACLTNCLLAKCGDNKVEAGVEECDNGVNTVGSGCSPICHRETCGNGIIDPGEDCDNGALNNDNADCRSDCITNRCGDGHINSTGTHHEDCDGGPVAAIGIRTAIPTEQANCNIDCTTPFCGDGKVNHSFKPSGAAGPEQCDNGMMGNADNADCTSKCQVNVCGDNLFNTVGPNHKEGCDDGNRVDTDNCNNACVASTCGDGIVGPNEDCDLGSNNSDTGACLKNCRLAACGDGKVYAGVEECDLTAGPQPCAANCKQQRCGNGIIDPGEDCDNGAMNNDNADCRSDCITNRCGDGHINMIGTHHEDCDGGPLAGTGARTAIPTEQANCNIDCTTPVCGDGKVNHSFKPLGAAGPEQCDNGMLGNADNADCTSKCQVNVCGDNLFNTVGPNHKEGCDDGNQDDNDDCTNACAASTCGDGIVGPNEDCDLGLNNSDTGACLKNCRLAACGDGKVYAGVEECDLTAGPQPCAVNCKQQRCGNGIIDPGEDCDNGALNNDNADCRSDCITNRCGDGHINMIGTHHEDCDGGPLAGIGVRTASPTEQANCNIDCTTPVCGDGKVNHSFKPLGAAGPEQCDNGMIGNADNADCTNKCQVNVCGDNLFNTVGPNHKEGCDDGNQDDNDDCTNACVASTCGDGIVGPNEDCDLGSNNSDTGACLKNCRLAACGDGKVYAGVEECDLTAGLQPCSANCKQQKCGNGIIDPGEDCDNGLLNNDNSDCRSDCIINRCGDGFANSLGLHQEDCDDAPKAASKSRTTTPTESSTCNFDCTTATCGDNRVNQHRNEECDDGGANSNTGACTLACEAPTCGDGFIQTGETCDDGSTSCGLCSAECSTTTTAAAAAGVIFVPDHSGIQDAESFTLDNGGFGTASRLKFQFFTGAATPPPFPGVIFIRVSVTDTSGDIADNIVNKINSSGVFITSFHIAGTGIVTLKHQQLSAKGNRAIVNNVASASFGVFGMSGGRGGDCDLNTQCTQNDDCASHLCTGSPGACKACARDADCGGTRTCTVALGVCSP